MLHCLNSSSGNQSDITVLERQRARMKWQQNQNASSHSQSSSSINNINSQIPIPSSFEAISRTLSSPPTLSIPKLKRKPHHPPIPKVVAENSNKDKRIKVVSEDEDDGEYSKNNNTTTDAAADTSSNTKHDYIHVRARRGQATDSHSLAERVRREKISERMKFLQDLVPGCNKITGKAGMLDEIINYVQSLQTQVEFLSMKLATVNPSLDFNAHHHLLNKEVFSTCDDVNASFPAMGLMMSSEMNNHPYPQFNSQQQIVSYGGLDTGMMNTSSDMGLRRTISAPETFIDSSSFSNILPSSTCWEGDFQNLYNNNLILDQPRSTSSFPSQLFTGLVEASNLKMEM